MKGLKRLENRAHRDDGRLIMKSQLIAIVVVVLLVWCASPKAYKANVAYGKHKTPSSNE